jgi:PBP1b-binding outer membrane lipoprotein LpoB
MKKINLVFAIAVSALLVLGCGGPSAEEQEKVKQEIIEIESANAAVDSTKDEVAKTSGELDSLLNQLNAQ